MCTAAVPHARTGHTAHTCSKREGIRANAPEGGGVGNKVPDHMPPKSPGTPLSGSTDAPMDKNLLFRGKKLSV